MKTLVFIGFVLVACSILIVGYTINSTLKESAGWEIQKAYMQGIGAHPLTFPLDVSAGETYIIRLHWNNRDVVITDIYPGFQVEN